MLAGKAIAGVLVAILFALLAILVVLVVASIYTSIDGGQLELPTATSTSSSVPARTCSGSCSGC